LGDFRGFNSFSFGAGNRDDEVIVGQIKAGKVDLAEWAEDFAEGFGENLEPAGADISVVEPIDSLFAILGSVDRGGRIKVVKLEENLFGTTGSSEPIADEGDARFGCG